MHTFDLQVKPDYVIKYFFERKLEEYKACFLPKTRKISHGRVFLIISLQSFAGLDAAKSSIKSLDTWMDLEKDYGLAGFKKATDLRKTWPHLKVNAERKIPKYN